MECWVVNILKNLKKEWHKKVANMNTDVLRQMAQFISPEDLKNSYLNMISV